MEHALTSLARAPLFARTAIDDPFGKHNASISVLRARYARRGWSFTALDDGSYLIAGHGHQRRLAHLRSLKYLIGQLECLS